LQTYSTLSNNDLSTVIAKESFSETELKVYSKKSDKNNSIIIVLTVIITFLFGNYILLVFEKEYLSEGVTILQILVIIGIFPSINYIGTSIFYIKHRIKLMILVNLISGSMILSLSIMVIHQNPLRVRVGRVICQEINSVIYLLFIKKLFSFVFLNYPQKPRKTETYKELR